MQCKYCGDEFETNKRGKKKAYCNKKECITKARNEAQRKWYAKKMELLKGTNNRIIERKDEKQIIYSARDKETTKMQMADMGDIIQIARELGTVRWKLIELHKDVTEKVLKFNKQDQTFLHRLEFLDQLTDEEAKKMIIEEKKSRELRRNVKNRKYLIEALLRSISMKNPNAFVIKAIQADGDICKTITNLKQDENLYANKETSKEVNKETVKK